MRQAGQDHHIKEKLIMYKYHLQQYAGIASRHTCPNCGKKRCFTYYVDESGLILSPKVGRCDHESSCGYHYTPREYFKDHPDDKRERYSSMESHLSSSVKIVKKRIDCIPIDYVESSEELVGITRLYRFLEKRFSPDVLTAVARRYHLGGNSNGDNIFYQIDRDNRVRAGKIISYSETDGHRIKDPLSGIPVSWVHAELKHKGVLRQDWNLSQCLFGEHLLNENPTGTVALVESEKSAVVCAMALPEYIWLATGGKSQLNSRLDVLRDRNVVAFPDVDAYEAWNSKLRSHPFLSLKISDILEKDATDDERERKIDIADWILEYLASNFSVK